MGNFITSSIHYNMASARIGPETQLLEFVNDITDNLENHAQTDTLIMDFSKAFDKVSHSLLIHKLEHYGIKGKTNKWIEAFLEDRHQTVVVQGWESDRVSVDSGVPQGSVLGPTLFLYYINDIAEHLASTVRLFADDTIAYLAVKQADDCDILQSDLDKLSDWEHKWKMSFHPDKCQVLPITKKKHKIDFNYKLNGHSLERVTSAKYLGSTINDKLDWGEHINNICNKANKTLGFLRRNLNIGSTSVKATAYKSFVRPTVEYACTVWDPHQKSSILHLEKVQRRGARYVKNRFHNRSSVSSMLHDLEWVSLEARRREARLVMLYKIRSGLVAIDPSKHLKQPTRMSRHMYPHTYQLPHTSTSYKLHSFFPKTIRDWNALPPVVAEASTLETFKTNLKNNTMS